MRNGDHTDTSDDDDQPNTSDDAEDIRLPTKKELRFLDDSNFISSEDTGSDNSHSSEPVNINQLNPRAKYIKKLFTLIKSENRCLWRKLNRPIDNCNWEFTTSLEMSTFKRKRDDTSSEDEGKHHKKKVHKKSDSVITKKVNHKNQAHHLSSSGEESFDQSVKRKHKKHKSKSNRNSESDKVSQEESQNESGNSFKSIPNEKPRSQINNGHIHTDKSDSSSSEPEAISHSVHPESSKSVGGHDLSDMSELELNSQDKDDNSESESDSKHAAPSGKLVTNQLVHQQYREHNFTEEDNNIISKYSSLLSEKVLKENNIWILQCPSNVDCSNLVNQTLNFNGNCLLDDGKRKYEAYSHRSNQNSFATLAVPNHRNSLRLCRIPITGHIILEETVKIKNKTIINIPESPQCVEFPENLRVRHPLLGTDYENQPRTIARMELSTKKKKKHTKTNNDETGVDTSFKSYSCDERSKKKKKKKRTSSNEDLTKSSYIDNQVEGYCESSKAKKKKHRRNDS